MAVIPNTPDASARHPSMAERLAMAFCAERHPGVQWKDASPLSRLSCRVDARVALDECAKLCDEYAEARLKDLDHPAIDRDYVQGERHGAMDLAQAFRAKAEGH